jgi:DNA gyrase subunit A
MIINRLRITIRLMVDTLRVTGRATQGVKLINLRENDSIAAVASVIRNQEVDETQPLQEESQEEEQPGEEE